MPRHPTADDEATESTATDQALADALGINLGQDSTDTDELQSLVAQFEGEVLPPVSSVLELLVATIVTSKSALPN